MKLHEANKQLKKIEKLYQMMSEYAKDAESDQLDSLLDDERRLMLRYIEKLHSAFVDGVDNVSNLSPPPAPKKPIKVIAPTPTPAPKPSPKPAPPVVATPAPKPEPIKAPIPEPTPEPIAPVKKPSLSPEPPMPAPRPITGFNKKYSELFEVKKANDLSEKLSQQPLRSLKRAFSINERILTTNELFDGDADEFNTCLDKIQSLSTFDETRHYLEANVIGKHEWIDETKIKKAKRFVDLIRRKFL